MSQRAGTKARTNCICGQKKVKRHGTPDQRLLTCLTYQLAPRSAEAESAPRLFMKTAVRDLTGVTNDLLND